MSHKYYLVAKIDINTYKEKRKKRIRALKPDTAKEKVKYRTLL